MDSTGGLEVIGWYCQADICMKNPVSSLAIEELTNLVAVKQDQEWDSEIQG